MTKASLEPFLTPVGRMVMGSLYEPQTKSLDGKPLVFKSGKNEGKPRVNYFFALAIPKKGEPDWRQTDWGAKICSMANALYPRGEPLRPQFSWKIKDGDSNIPNSNGKKNCEREGFPGHWVLIFGGAFAPQLIDRNREYLTKENAINCGDYIQVNATVNPNRSSTPQNVGIVLNCTHVALIGYGQPIEFKSEIDPKSLNLATELPPGASETPIARVIEPVSSIPENVKPHYGILDVRSKKMTDKALGTYDQMRSWGWTDEDLINKGMMVE